MVDLLHISTAPSLRGGCLFLAPALGLLSSLCQALPTCRARPDSPGASKEQSLIWREGDTLCFRLLRRKNRQKGSGVLKRVCSCKGGTSMCPIHTLWDQYFALLPDGARPWEKISAGRARDRLRQILSRLQVPEWAEYGTHDFRRGHAEARSVACLLLACPLHRSCQDMRRNGCTLVQILLAGQWKSASFLKYLNEV
jgi:hypothetical protein